MLSRFCRRILGSQNNEEKKDEEQGMLKEEEEQEIKNNSQYIDNLASEYQLNECLNLPNQLNQRLEAIANREALEKALKTKINPGIFRVLCNFPSSDTTFSIIGLRNHPALAKFHGDKIELKAQERNDFGYSALDRLILTRFPSLADKISIFHHLFVKGESQFEKSLKYILVVSYLADKPFYDHLESLILDSKDLNSFFPHEYSFNPYLGRKDALTEAVSHLLSIIAEKEVMREGGIQFMQKIIEKYISSKVIDFKYVHESNKFTVLHPIFYLISKAMWKSLKEWIEIDPGLLLLSDEKGKTPLISTIVTFSHGLIAKGHSQEHDALTNLQEFLIERYLELKIYEKLQTDHDIIEPQFALLLGYLECGKAQSTIDNENENDERFIKTTKIYYKSLITHFIKKDHELSRNVFLKSTIDNQTLCNKAGRISMYGLLLNHGYKLGVSQNINIEDAKITVYKTQKDALSAQEITIQLYKGIFEEKRDVKKINQYAINILEELQLNISECSLTQDQLASFISSIFKNYLVLKYTDDDVKNKNESQQKMHSILLEMIKKLEFSSISHVDCKHCIQIYPPTVSEKHMCLRLSHETFSQICLMAEIDLLEAISEKLSSVKIEPEESTQLMHLLLENSINAFWFSNKEKSDLESSKRFVKTAKILHDMIRQISNSVNEKLVDLTIEKNAGYQESEEYFKVNIQDAETKISSALDIEFSLKETKFVLRESSKNLKDYLHLYNFTVGMLSRLFLWSQITDAQLNLADQEPQKSSFFSFLRKKTQVPNSNLQNLRKAFKLALLVPEISENKKDLGRFFQFLIKHKDEKLLDELNDLTNDLWKYIILSEDPKEISLIPFILNQRNNNDYTFQVVRRLIKHRIIINDIDGCLAWINYGLNSLKSKAKLNTTFNANQGALIYYSLIQATGMANASIVEQILKSFPACLMGYDAITAEKIPSHELFSILRAHSKSKMMENQEFKQSVDKIAVLLLEYGYPIELIKKWRDQSLFDFVKSLAKDQLMYSAAGVAIDWVRNIIPCPAGIVDFGQGIAKTALGSYFYVTIYNDSFDFIYGQLSSSSKIDISEFCHEFSSILQPKGFLDDLREISFLTGLNEGLNEKPTNEKTRKNAQTVDGILKEMTGPKYKEEGAQDPILKKHFERTCKAHNIDIETLNQPVIGIIEEEKSNQHPKQEKRNFLLFRYKLSQPKEEIVVNQVKDFRTKLLARIGAAVITGTFIFLNDEFGVQKYVCAAVGLLPTVFSGLCTAASFASECLQEMLTIAGSLPVYTFLLPLIGGTIYVGYKIYKEHQANHNSEEKVMFDLRTIQKLVEKFQTDQNEVQIEEVLPDEEVYDFVKELFHSYNGDEFVPQQTFCDLMKRFGITETLKREVRSIKNREDNISFLEIVESLSLVATYLNAEKVREVVDDFKMNELPKSKLIDLLHKFMAGKVTNLRLEAHNQGIQYPVEKEFNVGARLIVLKDSYRHNLNDNVFYDLIIRISTKVIQQE